MSVSKAAKQQKSGKAESKVQTPKPAASPKKQGTRVGTLGDWRGAGKGKTEEQVNRRSRVRDGR